MPQPLSKRPRTCTHDNTFNTELSYVNENKNNCKVYIQHSSITENDIREKLSKCGEIVLIYKGQKGFLVAFGTATAAKTAVDTMDRVYFNNRLISCVYSNSEMNKRKYTTSTTTTTSSYSSNRVSNSRGCGSSTNSRGYGSSTNSSSRSTVYRDKQVSTSSRRRTSER